MAFVKATPQNRLFGRLRADWEKQAHSLRIPAASLKSWMDYADEIAAEDPTDERYGIFIVCGGNSAAPRAPFLACAHVNHKLPRTRHAEVRVVWHKVAPKFDGRAGEQGLAQALSGIISGAVSLSAGAGMSGKSKVYLENPIDRRFGHSFVQIVNEFGIDGLKARMQGTWLNLEK
jgi:hypothetical protein